MRPLLFSFLAGATGACGFEPIGLWPLLILSLVVLFRQIETASGLGAALARGWAFGLGQFVVGLNWIATSFTYQANMPAWLGWIAVVLLSLYLAVYPAVAAGLAWNYGRRDRLALALVLAAGWIVTEWLRASLFTGFAWNPIGVALLPTALVRPATLFGTYGISGIAVLLAGLIWLGLGRRWRSATALTVAISLGIGLAFLVSPSGSRGSGMRLRIVQPNIGQEEKWRPGYEAEVLRRLSAMSRTEAGGRRLLLWPEAAITTPLQEERRDAGLQLRSAQMRTTVAGLIGREDLLLTGGLTVQSADGFEATSATNSIFALDRDGRILARYDKAHLVPYGEYLPMRPLLSALGLSRLAPGDIDFAPGPGPQTLAIAGIGRVGFQLCYEIIFSGQVVDRRARPQFLFNPSNDAWFGAWGPPQHLAQARMRALEEGLPVLRATPTGISAVIDGDGRLRASLPWRRAGVIDSELPAPKRATPFALIGNPAALALALLLALAAIAVRRKAG